MSTKIAVVTGGGQGIGREICRVLGNRGFAVAVTDVNMKTAEETAEAVLNAGGEAEVWRMDVSDIAQVREVIPKVAERMGSVDVVVNNAGILHATLPEEITEEEWDRILEVNLKGSFFVTQAALPYMKQNRWGRIIFISSSAGRMGGIANGLAYSASKAGMLGLSKGLALRLAEWQITVNAVAPGTTKSDIIKGFTPEKVAELETMIPLKRLGRPKEIADLVGFLASEEAGFITGAVVDINGGLYIG